MTTEEVRFPRAGLRLHGLLRVPNATPSGRLPVVVHGPGFLGLAGAAQFIDCVHIIGEEVLPLLRRGRVPA